MSTNLLPIGRIFTAATETVKNFLVINLVMATRTDMPYKTKTPAAVLRAIIGISDRAMAELLNCSRYLIHSIETGRARLTEENAIKLFDETGICPKWLLSGKPKDPVSARGEPYNREFYVRSQAEKMFYDQPQEYFKRTDELHFAATLIAVMEAAHRDKNYFVAIYKIREALKALRDQFGQDESSYPIESGAMLDSGRVVHLRAAVALLDAVGQFGKREIRAGQRRLGAVTRRSKRSSARQRQSSSQA